MIKSRRLKWAGHVARMKEDRSAFKILTCKPTEKRPLGRPRWGWEDSVRMYFKEIVINTRNWVDSLRRWGLSENPGEPLTFISHGVNICL